MVPGQGPTFPRPLRFGPARKGGEGLEGEEAQRAAESAAAKKQKLADGSARPIRA